MGVLAGPVFSEEGQDDQNRECHLCHFQGEEIVTVRMCFKCDEPVYEPRHILEMDGYTICWCDECYPFTKGGQNEPPLYHLDEDASGDLLEL
jgi:hypothetical protein